MSNARLSKARFSKDNKLMKKNPSLVLRNALLSGAALMPFLLATANAQDVTINTALTTPVETATADSGGPANVTIDATGSVTLANGTGVTLNSDNTLIIDGDVTINPSDNSIGVLVDGTRTGALTMNGTIELESADPDTSLLVQDYNDNRAGVWFNGGTFTGDVTFGTEGAINVDGDLSSGLLLDSDLIGNLLFESDSTINGAGSNAIAINGNVTGNVTITNSTRITVTGANSQGIVVNGNIDGAFAYNGGIQATGYTSLGITDDPDTTVDEVAEQIALQGGSALSINGDVTGGILLNGPLPDEEITDTTPSASAGSIIQYGSAAAVHIGATGPVTIGLVDTSDLSSAYGNWGFINRSEITANGTYASVSSLGLLIENATIAGGFRNDGGVIAAANAALATGVRIGSGTNLAEIFNGGRMQVLATNGANAATIGLLIDAGATVNTITNSGIIQSNLVSDTADAVAIRDLSGSVTSLTNSGSITTGIADFSDGDASTTADDALPTGNGIAIDFSANTTGVAILNDVDANFDAATTSRLTVGVVVGDVLLGSGNDSYQQFAGVTTGDIDFGLGNDSLEIGNNSNILGNVTFGDGNDSAVLDDALYAGTMNFGNGTDTLTLMNNAVFSGGLIDTDGLLDVSVIASTLTLSDAAVTTMLSTLSLDSDSTFSFAVDGNGQQTASVVASGAVTIGDGAIIIPVFSGAFVQDIAATFLQAASLSIDLSTIRFSAEGEEAPFLFNFSVDRDATDPNALVLSIDRKSATEIGIDSKIAAAYEPTIAALGQDDQLGASFFNMRSREEFIAAFNQLIAQPLDAGLSYARAQNNSVTSIITQRLDLATNTGRLGNTVWLQEGNYFVNRSADEASNGYDGGGWIVAGGVDTEFGPFDAIGLSAHFASARFDEKNGEDFPFSRVSYGVGAYGAIKQGNVQVDAQASYSISDTESDRVIIISGINRFARSQWSGTQIAGSLRASYETEMSGFDFEPFVSADYLSLTEDAYTESGGGAAIDLSVDERDAKSMRLNIGTVIGKTFELRPSVYDTGIPGTIRPNIKLGWSQELLNDPIEANMRYVSGGDDFILSADPENGAALAAFDVEYENEYAKIHAGLAGSFSDVEQVYSMRIGVGLKW
jgi:uncharacterized protein with beta-barrel porin domain